MTATATLKQSKLQAMIDGEAYQATVVLNEDQLDIWHNNQHQQLTLTTKQIKPETIEQTQSLLLSPMPGNIVVVHIKPNQKVSKGDPLITIEAMKMEHTLHAPQDGIIKHVFYQVGDLVDEAKQLLEFK